MIESTIFIGAVIVAVTEFVKALYDGNVRAAGLIVAAGVVGAAVGVLDVHIGVQDVSIAQGVLLGLSASGVYKVASKVG